VELVTKVPETRLNVPVAIIGAGPSGLAAAQSLMSAGIDFALVDKGQEVNYRERNDPKDIVEGVGGSGLFSDGKFSFYPSATNLWNLSPTHNLLDAYTWFINLLVDHGADLTSRSFPHINRINYKYFSCESEGHVIHKLYDSIKMALPNRMAIIKELWEPLGYRTLLGYHLVNISELSSASIELTLKHIGHECTPISSLTSLRCEHLLIAGGRYSPQLLRRILPGSFMAFRRWEYGIRIEQPADSFFLSSFDQIDPKLIIPSTNDHPEYRTFCCCRDGEIVSTRSYELLSISGRSNGDPTGKSNIGFLVRFKNQILDKAFTDFLAISSSLSQPNAFPLAMLLSGTSSESNDLEIVNSTFGEILSAPLVRGLKIMLSQYPLLAQRDTILYMPAIEGLGYYPAVSSDLRIPDTNIWVAGDASGLFRGLTAAFISGWFAGRNISDAIENDHE